MRVYIKYQNYGTSFSTDSNTVEGAFHEALEYVNSRKPVLVALEGEMIGISIYPTGSTVYWHE